jgi:hypothetical protein
MFPNAGRVDRLEIARSFGARITTARTLTELVSNVSDWGVDGPELGRTLDAYRRRVDLLEQNVPLDAPIGKGGSIPVPLIEGEGPFWALEVQPSFVSSLHFPVCALS